MRPQRYDWMTRRKMEIQKQCSHEIQALAGRGKSAMFALRLYLDGVYNDPPPEVLPPPPEVQKQECCIIL